MKPNPIIFRKSYSSHFWKVNLWHIPSPSQVGYSRNCSRAPISALDANQNPWPTALRANNPTTKTARPTHLETAPLVGTSAIRGILA